MSKADKTLAFMIVVLLIMSLGLGLGAVWLNIERMDLAYDLRKMETSLDRKEDLVSKLGVERDSLASPDRLRQLAARYGLNRADQGQVRPMPNPQ